jgi:hypothetical protein
LPSMPAIFATSATLVDMQGWLDISTHLPPVLQGPERRGLIKDLGLCPLPWQNYNLLESA